MTFADQLNELIAKIGCSAKELSQASGVSEAAISRYRSGERVPSVTSEVSERLARGLYELACSADSGVEGTAMQGICLEDIAKQLNTLNRKAEEGSPSFSANLRTLLSTLGINNNALARALDFDPSFISRIQSGQRMPADLPAFVDGVAEYVVRNYANKNDARLISLFGADIATTSDQALLYRTISEYLGTNTVPDKETVSLKQFLLTLDEFDLNAYLKDVHFDELRVPTVPFRLPTTKSYSGPEGMKQAELDFLRAAATASSMEDVVMYSDMPMEALGRDKDFSKNYMLGIGALVKKGIRILNIHDVHRPLNEMFMGLEGWLPIYMAGRMTSFYLEEETNSVFTHLIRSAGSVSMLGEGVSSFAGSSRFVVSKRSGEVTYVRKRAQDLLAHAKPLARLFFEEDEPELNRLLDDYARRFDANPTLWDEQTFTHVEVSVLPRAYALVKKTDGHPVSFLIEHPALVNAFAEYQPTLW